MHNPRMKPRRLAYDCARLCRRKLPPSHSRRIQDDKQRLSHGWIRLWAVWCVVVTLAIVSADSMLPHGCFGHDMQALFAALGLE